MALKRKASLAIDFDGVICDTGMYKVNRARELGISQNLHRDLTNRTACERRYGEAAYAALSDGAYTEVTTLHLAPVRGAVRGIRELSKMADVYVLTSRSGGWLKPCEAWLSNHKLAGLVKVVISCPKGGRKLVEAGRRRFIALLDDDERHLLSPKCPKVLRFLFRHRPNRRREDLPETDWRGFVNAVKAVVGTRYAEEESP